MRGAVVPRDGERRFAGTRQARVLRQQDVEGNLRARALFAKDPEMSGEALGERVPRALVERDREPDGRGPERMR